MTEFVYNNFKNVNMRHIPLKLNCNYHFQVFFDNKCNRYCKSFLANKLATKLRKLINICHQNLLYPQDLQKQVNDKGVKL